jgi:transcriptional regulator with XRE-family HTH domain
MFVLKSQYIRDRI